MLRTLRLLHTYQLLARLRADSPWFRRNEELTITILSRAIEPFQKERIVGSGPDASLKPQNALMLTMVLHELATNAVKHGALSDGSGRVHVDWALRRTGWRPAKLLLGRTRRTTRLRA